MPHATHQDWLRDPNLRTTSSPILRALRPKETPRRRIDRLRLLVWHTLIEFRGEKIALRSAALTYITLLSIIPLLAVAFAVIRAIGQDELRELVHEFIFTNLVPGTAEQIGSYLDTCGTFRVQEIVHRLFQQEGAAIEYPCSEKHHHHADIS